MSYLSNRSQRVQIPSVVSHRTKFKYGMLQGSCLDPILFLISTTTLFNVSEQHLPNADGYADDHQIYMSLKPVNQMSQEEVLHVVQNYVDNIRKWMQVNQLKINDPKTEILVIASEHQLDKIIIESIIIGDSEKKPVTSVRHLVDDWPLGIRLTGHIIHHITCTRISGYKFRSTFRSLSDVSYS